MILHIVHGEVAVLNNLDLNLLRVFDALMQERSVLRAGQRIGLSQSAVSHALARLRAHMKDDLFVRTAQSMEPTSRASEIGPLVRDALMALEQAMSSQEFDAGIATRTFHIAATDYITQVIVPTLLADVAENAPGIDLIVLPATRIDLTAQIDLGRIDVAIGSFVTIPARLHSTVLFEDTDVLVLRADHPLAGRDVTVDEVAAFPMIAVAVGGADEGLVNGFVSERGLSRRSEMFDRKAVEDAFNKKGHVPRFSVLVPHFLAVPSLVVKSDRVAIMPKYLAEAFRATMPLAVVPTPWVSKPSPVQMVWHERSDRSLAHSWLRHRLEVANDAIKLSLPLEAE